MKNKTISRASVSQKDFSNLLKWIEREHKTMLDECWEYHKNDLLEADNKATRKNAIKVMLKADLFGWEDIGFFIGYLRALDDIEKLITENKLK